MNDETMNKINELLAERYDFFSKNIFPKTHKIAETFVHSTNFYNKYKNSFKINGMKFTFVILGAAGWDEITTLRAYWLDISYKFRKVLSYRYNRDGDTRLDVFHECVWINKLDGITTQIIDIENKLKKTEFDKSFKKYCKDYNPYCEVNINDKEERVEDV